MSKTHIIIAILTLLVVSQLRGQAWRKKPGPSKDQLFKEKAMNEMKIDLAQHFYSRKSVAAKPELIPYQIFPLDPEPDCRLELGVQLVHPYTIENMVDAQQQETLDIIYKRIAYEMVNPDKSAGLFQIDDKLYHLIRIPYTGATEDYGMGWTWR